MANKDATRPENNFRINLIVGILIASLVLVACSPEPTPDLTPEMPAATLASPTATTAPPTPTIPPATPTLLPPTPECPSPGEGTQLLQNEAFGYCFLYPKDYIRVDPLPDEVCLVPGEPYMACHTASLILEVEQAAGRTADQFADEVVADAETAIPGIRPPCRSANRPVSGRSHSLRL